MLRSSSPCSVPEASAWASCWVEEAISCWLAPDAMAMRCRPPTSVATWSEVAPISRAAIEKRAKASTLSRTATPVCRLSR
jgi:hypothetical protein